MKHLQILLLTLTVLVTCGAWSQTGIKTKINLLAKDWTVLTVKDDVKVEYKIESCYPSMGYDQNKLLLRLSNTSDSEVNVQWHALLEYDGKCKTCSYPEEYTYSIMVPANGVVEGDCTFDSNVALEYFSKFIDKDYTGKPVQLTGFELFNLTISTIQK